MLTATAHRQPLVVLVLLIVVPTRLLIEVLSYVDLRVWICAAAPGNYYCCHHFLLQIIHYLLIIDRGSLANCRIEYCCMFLSLALTPPRPSRSKQSWCLELHKEVHPFNRLSHCCVLIIPQLYTHYSSHSRHLSNTASDDNSILPAVLISIMDALSNILHTYYATLLVSMHRLRLPPLSSTFDFEVLLTTCALVKENNRFFWSKHCHRFCSTWITCISSKTTQSNLFLILHNPTTLYVFIQSPHVQQTLHNNRFVEKSFQAASYQHTGLGNRRTFDGADDIVSQVALLF